MRPQAQGIQGDKVATWPCGGKIPASQTQANTNTPSSPTGPPRGVSGVPRVSGGIRDILRRTSAVPEVWTHLLYRLPGSSHRPQVPNGRHHVSPVSRGALTRVAPAACEHCLPRQAETSPREGEGGARHLHSARAGHRLLCCDYSYRE